MSAPIRLFVSDVDGTLVRQDKRVGEPVRAAAERLRAAGVTFSLISARPLSGVLPLARELGIDAPVGAFNGGIIARPDGTILSAERLAPEAARRALACLDQPWTTVWVFADNRWHTRSTDNPHTASERITAAQEPVIVDDFTPLLDRVDKMVGVSDEEPRLAALERETADALGDQASVARSQPYYLDVTAPKANKGHGVRAIAEALGVGLDQVAVIGDGHNDVAMFKVAALAIAVGNASDAVKAAAGHVAAPNTQDGVADAADRFVIPAARR